MKLKTLKTALLAAACAQTAMLAHAAEPAIAAHTELKDCVIQEVLPGKNMTGAFVRFVHHGAPVELVRVEVPGVSPRIELHSMKMKDGVMEMARMTDLKLSEGERRFRKGGDHVMLFDIAQNPAIGSTHDRLFQRQHSGPLPGGGEVRARGHERRRHRRCTGA